MSETQDDLRRLTPELVDTGVIGERTRERITHRPAGPSMQTRGMRVAGVSDTLPPYCMVRMRPSLSQVLVCSAGEGRAWVKGEWVPLTRGQAYLSPPLQTHAFFPVSQEVPWEIAWVIFEASIELPWPDHASVVSADPEPVRDAILGLWRESRGPTEAAHLTVWAELVALQVRRLLRGGVRPDRLRLVWDAVEQDLAFPWTAHELADLSCLSEGQLRAVCQQHTGRSPLEQVALLRMRHAAALLLSTEASVERVAHAVGYSNPFAFSTAFKRVLGVPPSHYRR